MIIQKYKINKQDLEDRTLVKEVECTTGIDMIHKISAIFLEEHRMNYYRKYNKEIVIKIDYPND